MDGSLSAGEYLAGAAWLSAMLLGTGAAAASFVRRRLTHLPAPNALLAGILIFLGLVIAVHVVPGALGVLSRPAVLIATLVALAASLAIPPASTREPGTDDEATGQGTEPALLWAIAGVALVVFAAWLLAAASLRAPAPVHGTDVGTQNLPLISHWISSGSFWSHNEFLPLVSQGSYPHNSVVAMLAVVLPWESDFAVRFLGYLLLPLVTFAIFVLARELRAPRATAIALAVAGTAIPVLGFATVELTMPDVFLLPAFVGGCAFLVRHSRTGLTSELVLAGIGLGLAFGAKWYGVSSVVVVLGVWALASVAARRGVTVVMRQGSVLVGLIALCGGFWFVRNWVEYDNPLYPVEVEPLGVEIFDTPPDPVREQAGATLAGELPDLDDFSSHLVSVLRDALGIGGGLLAVGAGVALGWALVRLGRRARSGTDPPGARVWDSAAVGAVALAALGALAAYLVTPYTAGPEGSTLLAFIDSRYAVPGLALAAACTAALAGWAPRLAPAVAVLALVATIDGVIKSAEVSAARFALFAFGLGGIAALGFWFRRVARVVWASDRRWSIVRPVLAYALTVILVGGLALGYLTQDRLAENRIAQDATFAYVAVEVPSGARIGTAGIWDVAALPPTTAMLGPRMENEVDYVGPIVDKQLRHYSTMASFADALRERGYDYILVGRSTAPENREAEWARRLEYDPVAESQRFILYAVEPSRAAAS